MSFAYLTLNIGDYEGAIIGCGGAAMTVTDILMGSNNFYLSGLCTELEEQNQTV